MVVWSQERPGTTPADLDLYAQRFTLFGEVAEGWPVDGVRVCGAAGIQSGARAILTPSGAIIVAWRDERSGTGQIYAQRLEADGTVATGWPPDGLLVGAGDKRLQNVIPDGGDGAFVCWLDAPNRNGWPRPMVWLQHLSPNGVVPSWPDNGLQVGETLTQTVWCSEDGQGGVLVETYADTPRCCRVTGSGASAPGWPAERATFGSYDSQVLMPSGDGGAFIIWGAPRWDANDYGNLYAMRLAETGTPAPGWSADGLAVCDAGGRQSDPMAIGDGAGGLMIAWTDTRSGNRDVYAVRIGAAGGPAPGWPAGGAPIIAAPGDQYPTGLVPDGAGGAIIVWRDDRDALLHAQRLLRDGGIAGGWPAAGARVSASWTFVGPNAVVGDGRAGAYVAWMDAEDINGEIRNRVVVQRLDATGAVAPPGPAAGFILHGPRPNPAVGTVSLEFDLRRGAQVSATIVDLQGRPVKHLFTSQAYGAGTHPLTWDGTDAGGRRAPPGVYFARVTAGSTRRSERFVLLR